MIDDKTYRKSCSRWKHINVDAWAATKHSTHLMRLLEPSWGQVDHPCTKLSTARRWTKSAVTPRSSIHPNRLNHVIQTWTNGFNTAVHVGLGIPQDSTYHLNQNKSTRTTQCGENMRGKYHSITRLCRSNIVAGISRSPNRGFSKNFASLASSTEESSQGGAFLMRLARRSTSHVVWTDAR